jgi:hypothetical protein
MIDDTAHGSMRAHHPERGRYDKSIEGQVQAWENLIEATADGEASKGSISEGSDTRADVDPHTSFELAINNIGRIHDAKMAGRLAIAA